MSNKTVISENQYGAVYAVAAIPSSLFNFYILRRRVFQDGTAQWNICVEYAANRDKYLILDVVRGTREQAEQRLNELLHIEEES